jgi:hypothetical protein
MLAGADHNECQDARAARAARKPRCIDGSIRLSWGNPVPEILTGEWLATLTQGSSHHQKVNRAESIPRCPANIAVQAHRSADKRPIVALIVPSAACLNKARVSINFTILGDR